MLRKMLKMLSHLLMNQMRKRMTLIQVMMKKADTSKKAV